MEYCELCGILVEFGLVPRRLYLSDNGDTSNQQLRICRVCDRLISRRIANR